MPWRACPVLLVTILLVTSCTAAPASTADPLAGSYSVKGGGATFEIFQALADAFRKQHPLVRFAFEDVGSAAG
jgi:ABC-type phosphate transport system substrate-binding protein